MDRAVYDFKKTFNKSGLKEASSPQQCHFLLFFCPITSRAGTDIEAAVKYLNQEKASSYQLSLPVIMVVLHHTLDPEKPILDSNRVITSEDISAVDCLFDDTGLLTCQKNTNAISKIAKDLKSEKQTLYYCLKKDHGNPRLSTDQYAENDLLIPEGSVPQPFQRRAISFCGFCDLSVNMIVFIVVGVAFLIVLALIVFIYNKK